jgi:hypothetical protein
MIDDQTTHDWLRSLIACFNGRDRHGAHAPRRPKPQLA